MPEGDIAWRRPDPGVGDYAGPPMMEAPAPDWHPREQEPISTPRSLPGTDHIAIDEAEAAAARFTYGVGLAALVVLLVLGCSRVL